MKGLEGLTGRGVRVALIDSLGPSGDPLGHGTAVSQVLRFWAPEAEVFPHPVFRDTLRAPAEEVRQAVREACRCGMDVLLLSLAGEDPEGWPEALSCAAARGAVVVAAACARTGGGYPAVLPGALGVGSSGERRLFRRLAGPIEYAGPGSPSCAAAHVAGMVIRLRQAEPGAPLLRVRRRLDELFASERA